MSENNEKKSNSKSAIGYGCIGIFFAIFLIALIVSQISECQDKKALKEENQKKSEAANSFLDSADAYFSNSDYDNALIYYNKALEMDANNQAAKEKKEFILDGKTKPFIEEAETHFNKKLYDKALTLYEKALEINPNNKIAIERKTEIFLGIAKTARDKKEYAKAMAKYMEIREFAPNNAETNQALKELIARDALTTYLNDKWYFSMSSKEFKSELNAAANEAKGAVLVKIVNRFAYLEAMFKLNDAEIQDNEIRKLTAQARSKLKKEQRRDFPLLRKELAKTYSEIFWRDNIEVKAIGSGNSRLEFVGIRFANNANIEDFQKQVLINLGAIDIIKLFRFKRIAYRWSKYDDEYTYYSYDTPDDDADIK
jgi:tetratricopeptide (TPR) repeat protein